MSKKSNTVSTNRSKHSLKCHLIFVCKYRKKLLVGDLDNDMKAIMESITLKSDFEIEVFESDIDHIHFLIRYNPRLSITSIVRKLKQESTIAIWQKHKNILSKKVSVCRLHPIGLKTDGFYAPFYKSKDRSCKRFRFYFL